MTDSTAEANEEEDVTQKLKGDLERGQTLFDDETIGKRALTDKEQNAIRFYLYFLITQITISLAAEIISYQTASYNWALWAIFISYFANSTKLFACIQCLVSTSKIHGVWGFGLILWIGPLISLFVIFYDVYWNSSLSDDEPEKMGLRSSTQQGRRIRNDKIKHFQKSRVSIAALTAFCGIIDGFATVLNTDVWWLRIIFACWGAFCMLVGIITLYNLRHHPDFTFKKIITAPCQLLNSYNKKVEDKDNDDDDNNNDGINKNTKGYDAITSPKSDDGDEEQEDSAVL